MTLQNCYDNFTPSLCPACRSHRTRIVGSIVKLRLARYRCQTCGHVYLTHADDRETKRETTLSER